MLNTVRYHSRNATPRPLSHQVILTRFARTRFDARLSGDGDRVRRYCASSAIAPALRKRWGLPPGTVAHLPTRRVLVFTHALRTVGMDCVPDDS